MQNKDAITMSKLMYFDENTVTDYLDIVNGGALKKSSETDTEIDGSLYGKIFCDFKARIKYLFDLGAETNAAISSSTNTVVRRILNSTVLSSFLQLLHKNAYEGNNCNLFKKGYIYKFENCVLSVGENSLSNRIIDFLHEYMKTFPLQNQGDDREKITAKHVIQELKYIKGYFEFLCNYEHMDSDTHSYKKTIQTRFTIDSFRNGCTLCDVENIPLSIYAIYLGQIENDELFDVLLAGIECETDH